MDHMTRMPNELKAMVAASIVEDVTDENIQDLMKLMRTCRVYYQAGHRVLWKAVALRHPYLLSWAAEMNNTAVSTHLLDAGLDPDTVYCPPTGVNCDARCCQTYGPYGDFRHWHFRQHHDPAHHRPGFIFGKFYLIPDNWLWDHVRDMESPKFTTFCESAAAAGGHPYLGFTTLRGSHPQPTVKSKTWVINGLGAINGSIQEWRMIQKLAGNRNSYLFSPLHNAAAHGHIDVMRLLLMRGATLDIAVHTGCGCKHLMSSKRMFRAFLRELILDAPEDDTWISRYRWKENKFSGRLWTPLHLAICQGQLDSVQFLISQGAHHVSDARRCLAFQSPLHQAAAISPAQTGIVAYLLGLPQYSAYLSRGNSHGMTPLWTAYLGGMRDNVRLLIQRGADIDATLCPVGRKTKTSNAFSMLYHACHTGNLNAAKFLLQQGASGTTTYLTPLTDLCTEVFDANGLPGPFPMRPLDILVAMRDSRQLFFKNSSPALSQVLDDLITASGSIAPSPASGPAQGPYQDPVLMAARGHHAKILWRLVMHPSFSTYKAEHGTAAIRAALQPGIDTLAAMDPRAWGRRLYSADWADLLAWADSV
ncbi:ankyrin repeat-containing domain protein [Podospora conica]|nr:ankyrin repeat-containing domain protein [Schizothecium conicum]